MQLHLSLLVYVKSHSEWALYDKLYLMNFFELPMNYLSIKVASRLQSLHQRDHKLSKVSIFPFVNAVQIRVLLELKTGFERCNEGFEQKAFEDFYLNVLG